MKILKYSEFVNESNREEYIKNYCKESPAIPQVPVAFKKIHEDLIKVGKYKETLKSIDKGDAVIVGIRRKLEARKNGQEKYIDSIYFIPKNAKKENPNITPFQATTVPSVAWFDTDVAILDDSE